MRNSGDGRDVLHLEALRAGRFDEDRARIRLEQRRDVGADQRIVIGGLDAHALEQAFAEIARRPIDAVGDEDVVASAGNRDERRRNRRQTRRQQHDAGAVVALDVAQRRFERFGRRRSAAAILIA